MRKIKSIELGSRTVEVRELTVRQIQALFEGGAALADAEGFQGLRALLESNLKFVTDLNPDELLDMAPSELECLYEAFREVNASFFKLARQIGLGGILDEALDKVRTSFSGRLSALSSGATTA